jgi:peptidoglycan/xylan/chitin deacetylase (PgdA/CDA1 family)
MHQSGYHTEPWPIVLAKKLQIARAMRLAQRRGAIIVSYHGVIADRDWQEWETSDMVAESIFLQHLELFRKYYQVIPLRNLVAGLQDDEKLPPRALAITFDDGYRNNLQYAVPALKEYGLAATFFLTTDFLDGTDELWWLPVKRYVMMCQRQGNTCDVSNLGKFSVVSKAESGRSYQKILAKLKELPEQQRKKIVETMRNELSETSYLLNDVYKAMTWSDAKNIINAGMEVGAHSVSHTILAQESEEKIKQEVLDSVGRIKEELNMETIPFSYPDGQKKNCRQSIKTIVQQTGCYTGLMNFSGVNRKGDDLFELRRFPVGGHHTPVRLELDLCGLRALKERLADVFRPA